MLFYTPRSACAALLCLLLSPLASASEAKLAYDDYVDNVKKLNGYQHLEVAVRLLDEETKLPCTASQIYVKSRLGTELVSTETSGRVQLKYEPSWYDQNRTIIARTEGECELVMEVRQKLLPSTMLSYRELMVAIPEFRRLAESDSGLFNRPGVRGLILVFRDNPTATLVAQTKAGDRTFRAQAGLLELPLDVQLLQEDPALTLSALPDRIIPLPE